MKKEKLPLAQRTLPDLEAPAFSVVLVIIQILCFKTQACFITVAHKS